ncbi:hypothetical protein LBMAG42_55160 [Deltaproteobacteria bacterium]|nr:hypothetical protein LBMAG42_55160 [Deltaproteobacteria bacterium]
MSWFSLVGELIGVVRPERAVSTTPMAHVRRFQTTKAKNTEAGQTLDRFHAARRDTEAKITDLRLDTSRRESWAQAIMPRPLHHHTILSGKKVRVVGTPHPDDRVLPSAWAGPADGRIDRAPLSASISESSSTLPSKSSALRIAVR